MRIVLVSKSAVYFNIVTVVCCWYLDGMSLHDKQQAFLSGAIHSHYGLPGWPFEICGSNSACIQTVLHLTLLIGCRACRLSRFPYLFEPSACFHGLPCRPSLLLSMCHPYIVICLTASPLTLPLVLSSTHSPLSHLAHGLPHFPSLLCSE